ncbi:MAG: hypothetical protein GY896_04330, partial [Gammaproteobacteria bacterium]|nr:hypothetical protein [Gammaproteobacteria bacterium]
GDNGDPDDDNDGTPDVSDAFPLDPSESLDTDGDRMGNNADPDDDNDGVLDTIDVFPLDPTEWEDSDGDGIGDNADNNNTGVVTVDTGSKSSSSGAFDLPMLLALMLFGPLLITRRLISSRKK